jgi:hypothetical protein
MSQSGCSSNTNVACRTIKIKTNEVGTFVGTFTIGAVGGTKKT